MISEIIEKWIKGILIDGITGNLSGLFDNVNAKVGEIASDVGSTPQAWNSGIFNMLRSLSETVVLPIAAAILALVMCHELIQMITEKNNMHDFDTSMFFRWIFKSAFAILIVSNTWNIVMGVFDATQSVVNQSSGVIIGETSIHFDRLIPGLEFQLESMTIGSLLSLWFQTLVVGLTMNILSICIFLVTYGRMIEIYVVTALGPIPLATMGSSEWRSTGQNYLKSLLALGFQAFLIMSDTDTTFNFILAMLQSQLINLLCDRADDKYGGRLPVHVRLILDEFANIGQIPNFDKLIATIRSREISASIILQSQSQLKAIYKDAAEIISDNCDSVLFLSGRGKNAKEISDALGKETIDSFNTSENRGSQTSHGLNYQKLGKALMSEDEIAIMDGGKCILQLRGVRPFFSEKFDITKHPHYKYLADADKKNTFDVDRFLSTLRRKRQQVVAQDEPFDLYEIDLSDESAAE